ncbi:MAG: hypothetical protein NTV94_04065 [Planctomycetota bacterium]|nr:hypothetical protein [Planctomycetota bacterium]
MRTFLHRLLTSSGNAPAQFESLDSRAMLAADLAIAMVDNVPAFVVPGDKLTFAATVSNQGDTAMAGPVTVNFIAPSTGESNPLGTVVSVTKNLKLKPGQTVVLTAKWTVTDAAVPGTFDYGASIAASANSGGTENDTSMLAGGFDLKYLFGSYGNRSNVVLSTTDEDGTIITYSIKGPGYGEFRPAEFVDERAGLDLIGTTNATVFTMALKGGDRIANIDNDMNIAGSLRSFAAKGVNFTGSMIVGGSMLDFMAGALTHLDMTIAGTGPAMKFKAGSIANLRLDSATPIAAMDITDWQWLTDESNPDVPITELSTLTAPWIGKFISRGEFSAITSITGVNAPAVSVAAMKVGGAFGGQMAVVGNVGTFITGSMDSGMLVTSGSIAAVSTALAINASVWARSITRLDVGTITSMDVATGSTFDATALEALADGNGAVITWGAGSIGSITVKGSITQGRFACGVNPVNGIVLDEDDLNAGVGLITKIAIGGSATDLIIAATTLPTVAKIGSATVRTASDARFLWLDSDGPVGIV